MTKEEVLEFYTQGEECLFLQSPERFDQWIHVRILRCFYTGFLWYFVLSSDAYVFSVVLSEQRIEKRFALSTPQFSIIC